MLGKRNPYTLLVGMQTSTTTLEENLEASLKCKHQSADDPAISFLGIHPKECNTGSSKGTCTPMFIAAVFTIAKFWRQPRCSTINEWIKKM
jgi:hypothetical protein